LQYIEIGIDINSDMDNNIFTLSGDAVSIKPLATFRFEDTEPIEFITTNILLIEYNCKLNNDLQLLAMQNQNNKIIVNINVLENEKQYCNINIKYNNFSLCLIC